MDGPLYDTDLGTLVGDSVLLQQVTFDIGTGQFTGLREMATDEFTESGGVVVTGGLGVTESFKQRIG